MMPTMPPDSHKISLKIIEAIKQHPVLYISEIKGNAIKLQEFRQKVWKRLSDELGLDPGWVRLRWKNLRDTYCRILKYKNKTDKGARRKKWIFEDHLSFLKFPYESDYEPQCLELTEEYIREINSGGISSEGLLEQLEDKNDEDYSEYLEVLEETTADPITADSPAVEALDPTDEQTSVEALESDAIQQLETDDYGQSAQAKYKKIRPKKMKLEQEQPNLVDIPSSYSILKSSILDNNHLTVSSADTNAIGGSIFLTTPTIIPASSTAAKGSRESKLENRRAHAASECKTSIELFFESMAQTVKRLPPKAQADIKMGICRIVTEAEVRYSGQKSSQSTQQFIAPPGMIPKLVLIPCNMIDDQNKDGS